MKGRLLWLFWIGTIGIAWNLVLIGWGLWESRKLRRESGECLELQDPAWLARLCGVVVIWCRACLRRMAGANRAPEAILDDGQETQRILEGVGVDYPAKTLPIMQEGQACLLAEGGG